MILILLSHFYNVRSCVAWLRRIALRMQCLSSFRREKFSSDARLTLKMNEEMWIWTIDMSLFSMEDQQMSAEMEMTRCLINRQFSCHCWCSNTWDFVSVSSLNSFLSSALLVPRTLWPKTIWSPSLTQNIELVLSWKKTKSSSLSTSLLLWCLNGLSWWMRRISSQRWTFLTGQLKKHCLFCAPSSLSFVDDDQIDLLSFHLPILLQLPVFVWMREMESNERSFVNDFRASLFNRLSRSLRQSIRLDSGRCEEKFFSFCSSDNWFPSLQMKPKNDNQRHFHLSDHSASFSLFALVSQSDFSCSPLVLDYWTDGRTVEGWSKNKRREDDLPNLKTSDKWLFRLERWRRERNENWSEIRVCVHPFWLMSDLHPRSSCTAQIHSELFEHREMEIWSTPSIKLIDNFGDLSIPIGWRRDSALPDECLHL